MGSGVATIGGAAFLASLKMGAAAAGEIAVAGFLWAMGAFGTSGAPDAAGTSDAADIRGACEKPDIPAICTAAGAAEYARFK